MSVLCMHTFTLSIRIIAIAVSQLLKKENVNNNKFKETKK